MYWATLLWRGDRAGLHHLVERAANTDLDLSSCVEVRSGRVHDREWLRQHIRQLQDSYHQQLADNIINDQSDNGTTKPSTKSKAMQQAVRRGRLWRSTGKAISLQGISSGSGAALSGDDAAAELARFWGNTFAEKPGDPAAFQQFENFI